MYCADRLTSIGDGAIPVSNNLSFIIINFFHKLERTGNTYDYVFVITTTKIATKVWHKSKYFLRYCSSRTTAMYPIVLLLHNILSCPSCFEGMLTIFDSIFYKFQITYCTSQEMIRGNRIGFSSVNAEISIANSC